MRWPLSPPIFANGEQARDAETFHSVVWLILAVVALALSIILLVEPSAVFLASRSLVVVALTGFVTLALNRHGHTRLASVLFVAAILFLVTANALQAGGMRAPGVTMYCVIALLAGILLGEASGIATALVCAAFGFALVLAERYGALPARVPPYGPLSLWLLNCLYMGVVIVLLRLAVQRAAFALKRAAAELSERKRAEKKLELALDAGAISVWDYDPRTGECVLDTRGCVIVGLPAQENTMLPLEFWKGLVHPQDSERVFGLLLEVASGHLRQAQIAHRIVRPDGAVRHVEAAASALQDERSGAVRVVGTLVDVTDRKRAELHQKGLVVDLGKRVKELRLLHEAGQLLRDRPFDRIVLAELVAKIPFAWMFPECCQARIVYRDIKVSTPQWDASPWRQSVSFSTSEGAGLIEVAYSDERPQADEGPFLKEERALLKSLAEFLTAYLERDAGEKRRQRLEGELRQSQKIQALGTLAGGIAHDFNNLLGVIWGNAELGLQEVPAVHPARLSLEQILKASGRAKDIVKQVLLFSRRQESQKKTISLAAPIEEAFKFLRATSPANIHICAAIEPDLPPVCADASQLCQVVMNLGTNAVYAMSRDGGTLSLSLTRVRIDRTRLATALDVPLGEYVCLAARDTGIGMSQEIQERLFEPFFTTKGHAGTGLGLSVVHGIVRDHAGAITVESTIGCGSTFRIFLPVAKSAGMRPDEEIYRLLPGKGERVLYIDDEEDLAFVAERVLTRLGYRCNVYSDPRAALKAFSANPDDFDAVITDLAMPWMSGVDLARALRAIKPGLPIGLTTGLWEDDADCASAAGIRTVILKPASVEELSRAVRELLQADDPIPVALRI